MFEVQYYKVGGAGGVEKEVLENQPLLSSPLLGGVVVTTNNSSDESPMFNQMPLSQ